MKAFTTIMTLTTVLVGFAMAAPAPEVSPPSIPRRGSI